jgi:transposase
MCEFFGVSRAGYYAWRKRIERKDPDMERLQAVQAVYQASHKIYGFRRITMQLQDRYGLRINHKAVLRLMRKLGIRSVARKLVPYRKVEEPARAGFLGLCAQPEMGHRHHLHPP